MNYTEVIEKMNSLNGWVLISVIVSFAAVLLAVACIRYMSEINKNLIIKREIYNSIDVLIKEQDRHSITLRALNQKIYKLESLIKDKTDAK